MTPDERREVDRACLILLGYHELRWDPEYGWSGRGDSGGCIAATPSVEAEFIAPLVEALRARGWEMGEIEWDARGYRATLTRRAGPDVKGPWCPALAEALAVAAAEAMKDAR